jgi:hypothetical protein
MFSMEAFSDELIKIALARQALEGAQKIYGGLAAHPQALKYFGVGGKPGVLDGTSIVAFMDEMVKISAIGGTGKAKKRVTYHFSPKAGPDKWDKFLRNVRSQRFIDLLTEHPDADETLAQHAKAMHALSRGKTVGKVYSVRLGGRSYEIKETSGGDLACTCSDWRYKGSVNPNHQCKHIRAHKAGEIKAAN